MYITYIYICNTHSVYVHAYFYDYVCEVRFHRLGSDKGPSSSISLEN